MIAFVALFGCIKTKSFSPSPPPSGVAFLLTSEVKSGRDGVEVLAKEVTARAERMVWYDEYRLYVSLDILFGDTSLFCWLESRLEHSFSL